MCCHCRSAWTPRRLSTCPRCLLAGHPRAHSGPGGQGRAPGMRATELRVRASAAWGHGGQPWGRAAACCHRDPCLWGRWVALRLLSILDSRLVSEWDSLGTSVAQRQNRAVWERLERPHEGMGAFGTRLCVQQWHVCHIIYSGETMSSPGQEGQELLHSLASLIECPPAPVVP